MVGVVCSRDFEGMVVEEVGGCVHLGKGRLEC